MHKVKIKHRNGRRWIQLPSDMMFDGATELEVVQVDHRLELSAMTPEWLSLSETTQVDEQWLLERSEVFGRADW